MSKKLLVVWLCYLLCSLFFAIISGCTMSRENMPAVEGETITQLVATVAPTNTFKITATLRPTSTDVPQTSPPTSTTFLPTPSLTATLTYEKEVVVLAELMQKNGGCELPCWWGVVPGESNLEIIKADFTQKGLLVGSNSIGINGGYVVSVEFDTEEGIVQAISVRSSFLTDIHNRNAFLSGWQRYSLMNILSRHGVPSRVLVYHPFAFDSGGGSAYHLLVFYEDSGIVIEYRGEADQLNGDRFRTCPDLSNVGSIKLLLYQPHQVENVVEIVLPLESIDYIASPETVYDVISWQQATGTSIEDFYETFRNAESGTCFEFSS